MENYFFGTGRRKTSIAQVRVFKGTGKFTLADKENVEIKDEKFIKRVSKPLELVSVAKDYDVSLILKGGGKFSQQDAVLLGIARALSKIKPEYETTLKKEGLLTRDPREKERKKPGLKRARRAPQWSKR